MSYHIITEKLVDYKVEPEIEQSYASGYLFGRIKPGYVYETKSLRLDLRKFQLSSENRRILKKSPIDMVAVNLPMREGYDWKIHKLGKDYYSRKFPGIEFSASKIKQMLTTEFHYNMLLKYSLAEESVGYVVTMVTENIMHYCYPFYDLDNPSPNLGMSMMINAIIWAQLHGKTFVYLGGVNKPADRYKIQFKGLSWWDGQVWQEDLETLKQNLNPA